MYNKMRKAAVVIGIACLSLVLAPLSGAETQTTQNTQRAIRPSGTFNLQKSGIDANKIVKHTPIKVTPSVTKEQAASATQTNKLSTAAVKTATSVVSQTLSVMTMSSTANTLAATATSVLTEPNFDSTTWPGWEFYTSLPEDSLVRWHVTNSPAGPDWDADGYELNRALYIGNPYSRDFDYNEWGHDEWARSPIINVPAAEKVTIQWRDWHKNEDYSGGHWDSCYFYVLDLDTQDRHLLTHWYAWWEGNPYQPYWVTYEFDISQVAGHRVQIYLEFITGDGSYNRIDVFGQRLYGWFVDDILIQADSQVIYNEPFGDESRAGSNIRITDTVATKNSLSINETTISRETDSKTVTEGGNTVLEWLIPQIALDEEITISFTTILKDLIPNEVRVVNESLEMSYLSIAGTTVTETLGPQSIRVELPITLNVEVEKLQYFANEDAKVDVAFSLGANSLSNITGDVWKNGTLNNTSAEFAAGKLSLAVQETHPISSPIVNGTFEDNNANNWHGVDIGYYTSSSSPLSGQFSLVVDFSGLGYFYQDITIPTDIYSATLSLLDYKENRQSSGGDEYKIEIRDPATNAVLKTLYSKISTGWEATSRTYDLSEFAGQTVRLAFQVKAYYGTLMRFDDINVDVKSYTFAESGNGRYVIDAGSIVSWDKIQLASMLPVGTSYTVNARSASNINDLAQAEFVPMAVSGNDIVINAAPSRYLGLEFSLATTNTNTTPLIDSVKVNYFKVQDGDQLQLKVFVLDANNAEVKLLTTHNIIPSQGREQTLPLIFNTANNTPGNYSAKGIIYLNGTPVIDDSDLFEIVAENVTKVATGRISTDKMEYTVADNVVVTSIALNESANVQLQNISVTVTILNSANEVVKTFDAYTINTLLANSQNSKALTVSAGELPVGNYTARQVITMSGESVSQKETTFMVVDAVIQGKGIAGTLTADPITVKRRIGDLSILATGTNTGNVDLSDVTFRVRIYDTTGQTVLKEFSEVGQLPQTGTGYSKTHPYGSKVELMPGTYPMVLTAEFTFKGENFVLPLDARGFIVTNTPPVANAGSDISVTTTAPTGIAVTLNGSASSDENSTDEAKKNDIVSYTWKKGETVLGTGESLNVNLTAGVHEITLTVTDTCGATHSDTLKVTVTQMILPPTITDLTPPHETITRELALGAKATDAVWGIDWTTLVFKAGETVLTASYNGENGQITSALPNNSPDGWYDLNIFIKNQGGAEATTPAWRVGLDRTPPTITEMTPATDVYTNNAQPTITAKLADAFSGLDASTIKVKVGETVLEYTFNAETGIVTATVTSDLADGAHNAVIEVADKVGNVGTATWRIPVDKTPPTITSMKPEANTEINQSSQEISAVVTDDLSGIKASSIVLTINGQTVAHVYDAATGKVSFSVTGMETGEQTATVSVSDNAGNSSNVTWKFNVQLRVAGSEYLLFHNSKNGELTITGGDKTINGLAHSNAAIRIGGNNTTITGQTTAVGSISSNGNGHDIALQQANAVELPMPVYPYEYYVANATQVHNGDLTINGTTPTLQPGIHLVNGNVTIKGEHTGNITIVATGNIKVTSQVVNVGHADEKYKVALYSLNGNIDFSSNGVTFTGVIYAPAGQISVQSKSSTFTGAIVGDKVELNGQNLTLNPLQY